MIKESKGLQMNDNGKDVLRENIKKSIEAKMGFLTHVVVYILVNAFILLPNNQLDLNLSYTPTLFWGIGIVLHFVKVFIFNNEYIEKKVNDKAEL